MNNILVKSLSNICILVISGFMLVDLIHMLSRFRKDSSQSGYTFYYEENKNPVL